MCYRGNLSKRRSEKAAGGWSAAFPNGKTGRKPVFSDLIPINIFFAQNPVDQQIKQVNKNGTDRNTQEHTKDTGDLAAQSNGYDNP